MTDIPRWPKISLLDDPDEEERAKRQLNESRRKRGLEPLYPEAGFPPPPPSFAELLIGGGKPIPLGGERHRLPEPEQDPDPEFHKDPKDLVIRDSDPGESLLAQVELSGSPADVEEPPSRTNPGSNASGQSDTANVPQSKKPLTYEQVKRLVRENNRSELPDEMIVAIIFKESSFDPSKRSDTGASGLMQITKGTWTDFHKRGLKSPEPDYKHVFDPATNIQRGSAYLQMRLKEKDGSIERALKGYGPPKELGYAADIIAATKALQENPGNPVAALSKAYRRKYP